VTPVTFGIAIERGDVELAQRWLDEGLAVDFVGDRIGTGLMIAAWEGNVRMMELFYLRGARLDAVNKNGEQALQLAAFKGHLEAVKWLLDRGAPLDRRGNEWGALHYAVFNGHRELAQYLLGRGANMNARAPNQATSLMLAAREGHEVLADDLLKAGADPSLTNDLGETALVWAMRHGNVSIAKLVSSPEAFANAVRTQPAADIPPPIRSVAAPQQIEDLLRRIRQAEGQNLPAAGLRKQLATALMRQREENKRALVAPERKDAGAVKGIVITAQRQGGGEKAEIVYGAQGPGARAVPPPQAAIPAVVPVAASAAPAGKPDSIQVLLARIRAAKSRGEPTDDLRKQLMDEVSGYKP
jgi:hypothetical protein